MIWLRIMMVCLGCLGCGVGCYADSLVVIYRSGKLQSIPLDESISTISSLQYLNTEVGSTDAGAAVKHPKLDIGTRQTEVKSDRAVKPEPKSNVKFKWSEPVTGQ